MSKTIRRSGSGPKLSEQHRSKYGQGIGNGTLKVLKSAGSASSGSANHHNPMPYIKRGGKC